MSTKGQTPTSLIRAHLEALRAEVARDEQELSVRTRRYEAERAKDQAELDKLSAELKRGREEVAKFEAWLSDFGNEP